MPAPTRRHETSRDVTRRNHSGFRTISYLPPRQVVKGFFGCFVSNLTVSTLFPVVSILFALLAKDAVWILMTGQLHQDGWDVGEEYPVVVHAECLDHEATDYAENKVVATEMSEVLKVDKARHQRAVQNCDLKSLISWVWIGNDLWPDLESKKLEQWFLPSRSCGRGHASCRRRTREKQHLMLVISNIIWAVLGRDACAKGNRWEKKISTLWACLNAAFEEFS